MTLDDFKIHSLNAQFLHDDTYLIWDRAGEVASALTARWPTLGVDYDQNQQAYVNDSIQIVTGIRNSVVKLLGSDAIKRVEDIEFTVKLWRQHLEVDQANRLILRMAFVKDFDTIEKANAYMVELGLTKWPEDKVFDQPLDSGLNSCAAAYRFEDEHGHSILGVRVERTQSARPDDEPLNGGRVVIDFERATYNRVDLGRLNISDWVQGVVHILRRDFKRIVEK